MTMKLSATSSLCVLTAILTGCFTPADPKWDGPSTARFRIEAELLTDVALDSQDTGSATAGRWGFDPNPDEDKDKKKAWLLVITRITSVAKDIREPTEGLYDKYFERVWITIDKNAPLSHEISLQEVESIYLTGYDVNAEGTGYYRESTRLAGKVALMEIKSDTAIVKIDMRVFPDQRDNWQITETIEVPLTKTGIHATAIEGAKVYHPDKDIYPDEAESASAEEQSESPELDGMPLAE